MTKKVKPRCTVMRITLNVLSYIKKKKRTILLTSYNYATIFVTQSQVFLQLIPKLVCNNLVLKL